MYKKIFIFMLLFIFLSINTVHADSIIEPFFEALDEMDIAENYKEYHLGVDFILYLLIFGSALNTTISQQFGRGAALGLALVFSIAITVFEYQKGFALGDFWIVAIAAFIAIVIGFVYSKLPKGKDNKHEHIWTIIWTTYIIGFALLRQYAEDFTDDIFYDYEWIATIALILLAVAIVYVFFKAMAFISSKEEEKE